MYIFRFLSNFHYVWLFVVFSSFQSYIYIYIYMYIRISTVDIYIQIFTTLPGCVLNSAVIVHVQSEPYRPLARLKVTVHVKVRVRQPYVTLMVNAVQNAESCLIWILQSWVVPLLLQQKFDVIFLQQMTCGMISTTKTIHSRLYGAWLIKKNIIPWHICTPLTALKSFVTNHRTLQI